MPLMPYISPAAIGCKVVRFAGAPVSAYRCPISCNTASGQPSPEDEETVMTSESPINRAASAPVSTGTVRIDPPRWPSSGQRLGTGTAAGLPRLELGGKLLAYGRLGRPGSTLEHQLGGSTTGLSGRNRHAAEGWSVEPGVVDIVEADNADVRPGGSACVGDRIQDAEGDDVAEADNAVDLGVFGEQPHGRLPCLRTGRLTYH